MPAPRQDLLQLALRAHRKGDIATAERLYSKLLRRAPGDFHALHLLGVIRARQRRFAEADRLIAKALEINITSEALNNHAGVLNELGRHQEAIVRLNRALLMKPDYPEAHFNLGNALRNLGQPDQAARSFRTAIALKPNYVEALQNLSDSLRALDRHAEAIAALRRAIEISPSDARLHNNLGILLRDMGSLEEARQSFDRAIAVDAGFVGAYYNRARSGKVQASDGFLDALETLAPKAGTFPVEDRARLHFALGKAYEDVGRYDDAFASLLEGNKTARSLVDHDERATHQVFERTKRVFTAEFLAAKAESGSPSGLPIFIVGFPRSGTTLTEQILASHPKVHGAGEIGFLAAVAETAASPDGSGTAFPESVRQLDGEGLRRLGDDYVARLRRLDPTAAHITDKNLGTFGFLGLLHLILPQAKIIHVQRDPRDICLSCFSLRFAGNASSFSYDLGELGRHYRQYQEMMDHWRKVLPPGAVLELRYEDMIENLEVEARRIVEYCGLPWDERCLSFHQVARAVRTASVTQVRQPIYRSSMQRWRRFERHLGPLLEALGPAATEPENAKRQPAAGG